MKNLERILEEQFDKKGWIITTPENGWEQNSYIATRDNKKYFIKLNIIPKIMERLAELKVTPEIITTGKINNEYYMIQEFIEEQYIPANWFENNLKMVAQYMTVYHTDETLKKSIQETVPKEQLSLEGELEAFETEIGNLSLIDEYKQIKDGINELKKRYKKNTRTNVVPVHDDPNNKNIFFTKNKLQMIDWNKIRLSEPMSDSGALLWWYVPKQKWEKFLDYSGIEITTETIERIYLAAAKMSMGFIIWSVKHKKDYSKGLQDFTAAINMQDNPHAWFKTDV